MIATAADVVAAAHRLGLEADTTVSPNEAILLIEGWATAVAYEIASGLADGVIVDVDMLVASGRLSEQLRPWLVNILDTLGAARLAKRETGFWALATGCSLPSSASVVKALAAEHPARAAELLLAGTITGFVEQVSSTRAITTVTETVLPKSVLDFYDGSNVESIEASAVLSRLMRDIEGLWSNDRAVRVLLVGLAPLADWLASQDKNVSLTIFEPDRRRYERGEHGLSGNSDIAFIEHRGKLGTYDLIISVAGLHRLPADLGLAQLQEALAPRGLLVAVEPRPSLFKDVVFGLQPNWFVPGSSDIAVGSLRSVEQWRLALAQAGFDRSDVSFVNGGSDFVTLIAAEAGQVVAEAGPVEVSAPSSIPATEHNKHKTALFLAPPDEPGLAAELSALTTSRGLLASTVFGLSGFPDVVPDIVVVVPSTVEGQLDPAEALTTRCMEIKACAEKIGAAPAVLWLIFFGALGAGGSTVRPVETGAWAFSRTLANEFHNLDVRRIDVAQHLASGFAAEQIRNVIFPPPRRPKSIWMARPFAPFASARSKAHSNVPPPPLPQPRGSHDGRVRSACHGSRLSGPILVPAKSRSPSRGPV